MATDNQENENNTAAPSLSKRGAARRRVTRAGVGAVGVLSTLSAHATLARTSICNSPSNMAQSLGVVNSHVPAPKCSGRSADWWWNNTCTSQSTSKRNSRGVMIKTVTNTVKGWPGACSASTMFSAVFYVNPTGAACPSRTDTNGSSVTSYQAGSYYCATLFDLLQGNQNCDVASKVGREFVAAYLNIASGYIGAGALTLSALQNIWYELQMSGVYHATGTITWDAKAVANYLNAHINITE